MTAYQLGLCGLLAGLIVSCSLVARQLARLRSVAGTSRAPAEHRFALRDGISASWACDATAGMWSEPGWRARASQSIADAPGCVALVLIDPERPHNEAAIAQCLSGVLRPSDPVGRYGTRQVAALIQVDMEAVGIIVTERVRARLDRAGIVCLVGVSISLGEELGELLIRAGSDLMARRESAGISARW
jgi:hypothetical protein